MLIMSTIRNKICFLLSGFYSWNVSSFYIIINKSVWIFISHFTILQLMDEKS